MKMQIKKWIATALVMVSTCTVCAQETGQDHIKEIFSLAKKSAEEDFNIDFYGFFTGMSHYDAQDLAAYYKLKDGEYLIDAAPGKAVGKLWFSLKGVRRITRGGNTLDELAQAVAKRVGDLKKDYRDREWEHKTIDGIVVTFGERGLSIQNDKAASQQPIATEVAAKKNEAAVQRIAKQAILSIIGNMVDIPGKSFKMGKFEVTQKQWVAVMGDNPSEFKGDDNPVENVSWDDCKNFLEKLNAIPEVKASGLAFRLPTDTEWEYACRAGGTGGYCRLTDGTEITGDTLSKVAWHEGNCGEKTHPVGQKIPNAFGLYDMIGNVWEWCEDLYDTDRRVGRGRGWQHLYGNVPPEYGDRAANGHYGRSNYLGFRLVADQK